MTDEDARTSVKAKALELGFDSVGITDLTPPPHASELDRWLPSGMSGTMTYMGRQAKKRKDPGLIFKDATRAIVLTKNYYLHDSLTDENPGGGKVAMYARGVDYHSSIGIRLDQLCEHVLSLGGNGIVARGYVDAGPVPERELAQRAGLGWIGKNTMLLDPKAGSFFFIASVFTNLDLPVDEPFSFDRCGECRLCIDACPTDAIVEARVIDARLCISYLTIESREEHPPELRSLIGDLVFGCDICQDVCPWNEKFAKPPHRQWLDQDPSLERVELRELKEIDQEQFDVKYGFTPLQRPGLDGMKRNARTVVENLKV